MTRPIRHRGLRFKYERRDIGRAIQKKITRELRFKVASEKGLSLGEMIFRTSVYTSKQVRTIAGISIAGSLRKRRATTARAPMKSVVIKDPGSSINSPDLPTGSRKAKYRQRHKPLRIEDIDPLAVVAAFDAPSDLRDGWEQAFKNFKAKPLDGGLGALAFDIEANTPWGEHYKGNDAESSSEVKLDDITLQQIEEMAKEIQTGKYGTVTEVNQKLQDALTRKHINASHGHFSFRGVVESIINPDQWAAENHWIANFLPPHLHAFAAMPEPQEDVIVVTQAQKDQIDAVNKRVAEGNASPLVITRGHYGDLQAASAYPGCQKIFDELTKNGVEFIEQDDPRAKLCDYSVCFMYPQTITVSRPSHEITQSELDKILLEPLTPGEKIRFNSELPHHAPGTTALYNHLVYADLQKEIAALSPESKQQQYSLKHLDTKPQGEQDE